MISYLFSSLRGKTVRNELLFLTPSPLSDLTFETPGLHEGERTRHEDDRRLGLDRWDSSEMIAILSASSSG